MSRPPASRARAVIYLTLIAALSLGVTTVIRESAAAIGVVLGIPYLFPVAASLFRDPAVALWAAGALIAVFALLAA